VQTQTSPKTEENLKREDTDQSKIRIRFENGSRRLQKRLTNLPKGQTLSYQKNKKDM